MEIAFLLAGPEVGLECQWFNNTVSIAQGAGIWVKPNTNQQYIIKQDVCGILSYDTIQVNVKNINCSPILNSDVANTFTPNGDGVNDVWNFSLGSEAVLNGLGIYNRWGNLIKSVNLNSNYFLSWDSRTTSGEPCTDGVYFYIVKYKDANGIDQQMKGYISLFK